MSKEKKDGGFMNLLPFKLQMVQVRRSKKHGVGLFAIQNIPKTWELFGIKEEYVSMSNKEFSQLHKGVQKLISFYCIHRDGFWEVPKRGFSPLDEVYFVNHSNRPNITTKNDGESFVTTRRIMAGEEITLDYRIYNEDRPYLPGKK
jgi:SET domain-containing protein